MTNEEIRNKYWLNHLISQDKNWIDGDLEDTENPTADFVNHALKLAVELKVEESRDYFFIRHSSNRIVPYLKSANKKFSKYPEVYKTILFIESNCTVEQFQTAEAVIYKYYKNGLDILNKRRAEKKFNNIGSIILWPYFKDVYNNHGYGWELDEADLNRKVNHDKMGSLLGIDIQHYVEGLDFSVNKKNK